MSIQEFDNLADWFKENVLDITSTNNESDTTNIYEEPRAEVNNVDIAHPDLDKPSEAEDELSLIEYIIGIDGL